MGNAIAHWRKLRDEGAYRVHASKNINYYEGNSHGYGDTIVAAWIAEGTKGTDNSIIFHATGDRRLLLEKLGQKLEIRDYTANTQPGYEYVTDQFTHGNPSFLAARALRNGVVTLPLRPLIQKSEPMIDCDILICPHATCGDRRWPWENWLQLFEELRKKNITFRVTGIRDDFINKVPESIYDYKFTDLFGMLEGVRLFVGVDSGPAHLAGTLDKPSIVLLGRTTADVYTHCINTDCITTPRKLLDCSGCWSKHPYYGRGCTMQCEALRMIEVDTVLNEIERKLRQEQTNEYLPDKYQNAIIRDMVELHVHGANNAHWDVIIDRYKTFSLLLKEASKRFIQPRIIETGCIRNICDWTGTGMSSLIFAQYTHFTGGSFTSIDLEPKHVEIASKLIQRFPSSSVINSDSRKFLESYEKPIDILYLDSCDLDLPEHQDVNLQEIRLAEKNLHKNSMVLIDDTPHLKGKLVGKGAKTVPYLLDRGWRILYSGYQVLLCR